MTRNRSIAALLLLSAWPVPVTHAQQPVPSADPADRQVQSTVVEGVAQGPIASTNPPVRVRGGDISINFPSADVRVIAKAVLGDIMHVPFTVAPGISNQVTVVTPRPISRASVIPFLEDALRTANLALVSSNGSFSIQQIDQAKASGGVVGENAAGYGTELVQLQFVSAEEMKRLLDPVLPGVVSEADSARNTLVIVGTSGQRASARDLLKQFDVNWLRNMSFALIVPQRTDSRLIVPELEKLINAPDAPTRGLVRLISMEKINGILAVSRQRQYLDDVNRWIEILDREGQNNEARLFVYRVQNGRSRDLAKTLNTAFGNGDSGGSDFRDNAGSGPSDPFGRSAVDGNNRQASPPQQSQQQQGGEPLGGQAAAPINQGNRSNTAPGAPAAQTRQSGLTANISSDETNNAVVVFGTPREYAIIEDALRKLDVLPYQVLIEAAITEVTLTNDLRYGLQWNFTQGQTNGGLSNPGGSGVVQAPALPGLFRDVPGFSFYFARGQSIAGVLNTLESKTNVNVVSAPKLLVLNNQTAALQVGDQVPIATQNSTSNFSNNSPTINSVEYRDTGVILKVTPRVNGSGLVLLDIAQEVSAVNLGAGTGGVGINSPTISTRRITTSVAVQDGEVLALGGLIRNSQTKGRAGLPFLSQIPVVGGLFGKQTVTGGKTELIVLLRPRVIRTIDDGRAITDELRAKIKTLEPFKSSGKIP